MCGDVYLQQNKKGETIKILFSFPFFFFKKTRTKTTYRNSYRMPAAAGCTWMHPEVGCIQRNRESSRRRMQLAAGVTLLAVIAIAALASTTSAQPTSMSGKVMTAPLVRS
jgi:hypothetical protein